MTKIIFLSLAVLVGCSENPKPATKQYCVTIGGDLLTPAKQIRCKEMHYFGYGIELRVCELGKNKDFKVYGASNVMECE